MRSLAGLARFTWFRPADRATSFATRLVPGASTLGRSHAVLLLCLQVTALVAQDSTAADSQQWTWRPTLPPAQLERIRTDSIIAFVHGDKTCRLDKKVMKDLVHLTRLPTDTAVAVLCHSIWVGMSEELLYWALGRPSRVNRTESAGGTTEQLVYEYPRIRGHQGTRSAYIYIDRPRETGTHYNSDAGRWERVEPTVTAIQISE